MENIYEERRNPLINVFGNSYLVSNNYEELGRNYQELLSLKNQKLESMKSFILEDNHTKKLYFESWELDLLLLTSYPGKTDENMKDYTYFSFKELDFIKLLKSIASKTNELSEEEFKLLYSFIRNRKAIEELTESSVDERIALSIETVKILYSLVTSRQVTFGHNIKAYERLCHSLNLTNIPNGPQLELKSTNNQ